MESSSGAAADPGREDDETRGLDPPGPGPSDEPAPALGLFEGYGIEIEYMIVDREDLSVRPISDLVLSAAAGEVVSEVECGALAWSNELVMHVIELKTNGPSPTLDGLADAFAADVRRIDAILEPHGARLMPTGMHPWMDPATETRLWHYEYSPVYEAYDRIFDCRGHGWSNLQSMHVNLPFADDEQFGRLHAAIRMLLPILPALSASSPIVDGRTTATDDNRMRFYRGNSRRIPSVAGRIVPEPVSTRAEYEDLLARIYRDVAPHDSEGVLQHEFLNARGAIARFDRHAIEIRVLDVQECCAADLAIAETIVAVLRALVDGRWIDVEEQVAWDTGRLATILDDVVETSGSTTIRDAGFLAAFGAVAPCTAAELWLRLIEDAGAPLDPAVATILERGTLARRIRAAAGSDPSRERLAALYRRLCDCLHDGRPFDG